MSRYDCMIYKRAGKTGLKLPALSMGLWHNFGNNGTYENMVAMLTTAFDHGITHFDCANNYGPEPGRAEINLGKILKTEFAAHRDELIISTKAACEMWDGPYGQLGSRKHLLASLDQSLKRLGLDYVDIFYMHTMDEETPIEESMLALDQAIRSGKTLYVALSNYNGPRAKEATDILRELKTPFVLHQNSYSILNRRIEANGLRRHALESGQGIIAFKPLESGILTNKYFNGIPADSRVRTDGRYLRESSLAPEKIKKAKKLHEIALRRGQSLAQMALAWVIRDPAVTSALIGASKPTQILENLEALNNTSFSDEELTEIENIANS